MDMTAQERSWVRNWALKTAAAAEARWTERMRAWLTAPAADGGMGMTAERAEKAARYFRGEAAGAVERPELRDAAG